MTQSLRPTPRLCACHIDPLYHQSPTSVHILNFVWNTNTPLGPQNRAFYQRVDAEGILVHASTGGLQILRPHPLPTLTVTHTFI